MKSGAINIDRYTGVEPEQKFNFLYENFSILQELLPLYQMQQQSLQRSLVRQLRRLV